MVFKSTRLLASAAVTLLAGAALSTPAGAEPGPLGESGMESSAEQRFPAARGWSASEVGLRVAGPDITCTYLLWLPASAPSAAAQVQVSGRTYTLDAGAAPQRISTPKPCNAPRTVAASGEVADSADVVSEELVLPAPQFGVTSRISRHTRSVLALRGSVTNAGTTLPPTETPAPPVAYRIREVRVAFLDYARTTARTCVWLTARAGRVATVDRQRDPSCERAPARAGVATVQRESWSLSIPSAGNPGRLVLVDDAAAIRVNRAVPGTRTS